MLWLHGASIALQPRLSTRQHAIELRDRGYTVIPDAGINPSLIAEARAACLAEHEWLLKGVAEFGIDTVAVTAAWSKGQLVVGSRTVRPLCPTPSWRRWTDASS